MKEKYLYFWKPIYGDVTTCLSQWYIAPFIADGIEYACAEQYMMAQKALLFSDKITAEQIMKTTDPKTMKSLGREVRNFNDTIWNSNKKQIVFNGNIAKFSDPRNVNLKEYLIATDNMILVEASPYDKIWGIGLDARNAKYTPENRWPGQNLLGKILMNVREYLKNN